MPKVSEVYVGGNFLSVTRCNQTNMWNRELTVAAARAEMIRDTDKIVLSFHGESGELPLNKTNATILSEKYGDDTNAWIGRIVRLIKTKQTYQGKLVDAIQVVV